MIPVALVNPEADFLSPQEWGLMLSGFFDDSGKESNPGNRIVCIAGYLAHANFWSLFHPAWAQNLMFNGISWLHMKDFMFDSDEYASKGWDWPKKREIIEGFMGVIKSCRLIGYGVAVDAEAWRKIPRELTDREGNAQEFCFMRIMRMLVERMKISLPRDVVSVCFDCDLGFSAGRFRKFVGIRESSSEANRYLQSFSIAEPKAYLGLQAADLLAWETRKELMRKLGGFESRPEFKFLLEASLDVPMIYESELWDASEIEEKIIKPFSNPK